MFTRRTITALLPVLLSLLLLSGCIGDKDGGVACEQFSLQLRYTLDPHRQNNLPSEVGDVRVYVFDQGTGLLAAVLRIGGEDIERGQMQASMPDGTYTFVAWANGGDDITQGGYTDAAMTDPASHAYTSPVAIGTTTREQFRMMLLCDPLPDGMPGELTPRVGAFDDLFYAMAGDVQTGVGDVTVDLDFVRNTSLLKVHVTGLEHIPAMGGGSRAAGGPPAVFVTAPHERYGYDDRLDPLSRQVRYQPPHRSLDASSMEVDIKVHRLEVDTYAERPVMLYMQDPDTGEDIVPPVDVVETILSAKGPDGNSLWRTQQDVDRQGEFDVEIAITSEPTGLDVSVTVEGYRVVGPGADVGRP